MLQLLFLIPLLPFAGFVVTGLAGARMGKRAVGVVACGTVLVAFVVSLLAVTTLSSLPDAASGLVIDQDAHRVTQTAWTWMVMGPGHDGRGLSIDWSYVLDPLSAVMLLVVTGIGFLIHVYATGYMQEEPEAAYARFFAYLNLFMAMMLTLVLGGTLPVVFVGWEGVGLCSYLLIGFYYDRMFDGTMSCADAGRKAFIVNRVGDMGFMLGMLLLFGMTGTLDIQGVLKSVPGLGAGVCTAAALLLFLGACGKSAQIPLYVWLPDAMAGPTPVSALIHAATMVTAGVYVMVRMGPLLLASPEAMTVVAVVGGLTALFAASMGLCQRDIKKVLAYSTVSQLGYMMLAVGVGAFGAGIFHLMTHAFFKALLFLGAGSVIHALSGEQDIMKMGGLARRVPRTHAAFLAATLAISGIFPLSGFFSKDEILWNAWRFGPIFWLLGALGAVLTAFYMTRLYILVFRGAERFDEQTSRHLHESPPVMTVPLLILAMGSIAGGWVGIPRVISPGVPNFFERWLEPVLPRLPGAPGLETAPEATQAAASSGVAGAHIAARLAGGLEIRLMALSLALALGGMALGWLFHERRPQIPGWIAARARFVYRLVFNAYYVDALYGKIILAPYAWLCRAAAWIDRWVVDGVVNAAGYLTLGTSYGSVGFDTFVVDGLVNVTGRAIRAGSRALRVVQTGVVQSYATAMVLGIFVLVSAYLLLMGR
jgi:NADH-quinone oxidoreductase subunit L